MSQFVLACCVHSCTLVSCFSPSIVDRFCIVTNLKDLHAMKTSITLKMWLVECKLLWWFTKSHPFVKILSVYSEGKSRGFGFQWGSYIFPIPSWFLNFSAPGYFDRFYCSSTKLVTTDALTQKKLIVLIEKISLQELLMLSFISLYKLLK